MPGRPEAEIFQEYKSYVPKINQLKLGDKYMGIHYTILLLFEIFLYEKKATSPTGN